MRQQVKLYIVRMVTVGLMAGLGVVLDTVSAYAQYPVSFTGKGGATSGFQCFEQKVAAPNQPENTDCWAVIVWYKGTFLGFNNYSVGAAATWTNSIACPASYVSHISTVTRLTGPEALGWEGSAYAIDGSGFVTRTHGQVSVQGGLGRDLSLSGRDYSKCNP